MDCILDFETNGLPAMRGFDKWYDPVTALTAYQSARIIEVGYVLSQNGAVVAEKSFLIRPDAWVIRNSRFHGITHEEAVASGRPLPEVLQELFHDLETCQCVVAHNANFEKHILWAECLRYDIEPFFLQIPFVCTMQLTRSHFHLQKWPSLKDSSLLCQVSLELHAHRALDDAKQAAKIYHHLISASSS